MAPPKSSRSDSNEDEKMKKVGKKPGRPKKNIAPPGSDGESSGAEDEEPVVLQSTTRSGLRKREPVEYFDDDESDNECGHLQTCRECRDYIKENYIPMPAYLKEGKMTKGEIEKRRARQRESKRRSRAKKRAAAAATASATEKQT